jgi:acyl-[acyl-carrier-protein]-phospholipid O-acyltransferase/long-chain-fatty-acid--[acyl-carrier-protein] ligase
MLGITLFGIDLYFASIQFPVPAAGDMVHMGLPRFLSLFSGWRILVDLFMVAVSAGVYIVPLYAIMQHDSLPGHRARIIAANNIVNALFMVGSALAVLGLFALSFTIPGVFLGMALANGVVGIYIHKFGL